jgi:hypothetical protein
MPGEQPVPEAPPGSSYFHPEKQVERQPVEGLKKGGIKGNVLLSDPQFHNPGE